MDTCSKCIKFIADDNEQTGSCLLIGDEALLAENKTVFDSREQDCFSGFIEVGINFGCIHFSEKVV